VPKLPDSCTNEGISGLFLTTILKLRCVVIYLQVPKKKRGETSAILGSVRVVVGPGGFAIFARLCGFWRENFSFVRDFSVGKKSPAGTLFLRVLCDRARMAALRNFVRVSRTGESIFCFANDFLQKTYLRNRDKFA